MKGKPSSLPSLSRLDMTSAALRTSTRSPGFRAIADRSTVRRPPDSESTVAVFDESAPLAVNSKAASASSIITPPPTVSRTGDQHKARDVLRKLAVKLLTNYRFESVSALIFDLAA